ncbi:hypothetical protein ACFOWE_12345, partial [Planomonospora corallina]
MRFRVLAVLAVLLALAAAVVSAPGTACACSCVRMGPAEQVEHATAVFTGTVTAVRRTPGGPLDPEPPVVYVFRADQVYKGELGAEVEVASSTSSAACGYAFTVGARYLVLASDEGGNLAGSDPGVPLTTTLCSGNREVRPGDGPLREDDVLDDEPLAGGLLAALGTARPPAAA